MKTKKPKIIGVASSTVLERGDFMGPRALVERMFLFNDGRVVIEYRTNYGTQSMAVLTGEEVLKNLKKFTKAEKDSKKLREKERAEGRA